MDCYSNVAHTLQVAYCWKQGTFEWNSKFPPSASKNPNFLCRTFILSERLGEKNPSFHRFLEKCIYSNCQKTLILVGVTVLFCALFVNYQCTNWSILTKITCFCIKPNSWIKIQCVSKVHWECGICSLFAFYFMTVYVQCILFKNFC